MWYSASMISYIGGFMHHYTYEIEFENGMKYIGVRSCKVAIEKDSYYGSSKIIPAELYATCNKTILGVFSTRVEALQDEIRRHEELNIGVNPLYYNQVKQTAVGFDQSGTTKETHEHVRRMAEKLKGRTREQYEYLVESSKKSATRRGSNRTDKQKAADLVLKNTKGIKNSAKGNSGPNSPKFRPWYYITPLGEYTEVYTSIRDFVMTASVLPEGTTYNGVSRCVREIGHRAVLRGVLKDYIFGYLDSKPTYLTQENIVIALQVLVHLPFKSPNKETPVRPEGYNPISHITGKK